MNPETKQCNNCKNNFTIEPDDFSFYQKMGVPAPSFCPDCRFQRRLAHRNDRSLYRRECGLCNKKILSIYHAGSEIKNVYCPECWWSDNWDPFSYEKEYDFSKDFFSQYLEFKKSVPHQAVYQSKFVDSEYSNFGTEYKNCYLVFGGYKNENVCYGNFIGDVKDSSDVTLCLNLELSYENINCFRSSSLRFCSNCEDSSDLALCVDCKGCVSCFGCVGLRNKQHYIFNEKYSKEEYDTKIKELNLGSYTNFTQLSKAFSEFALKFPFRSSHNRNVVDCTGEDLQNSKNSLSSFWGNNLENVKNIFFVVNSKDSQDLTGVGSVTGISEQLYEISSSFGGNFQIVGIRTLFGQNIYYSEDCHNCTNIFGCIGLKKKSYCIFNKQYSKEDYEALLPKIISQMKEIHFSDKKGRTYTFGDFWPIECSPFGYNETKVMEYFPLTKQEIEEKGYNYFSKEIPNYQPTILNENIPDDSSSVSDEILKEVIECGHKDCNHGCTRAFKIIPNELQVIQRLGVPLPHLCPNCRHYERLKKQNPIKLWHRQCMCNLEHHEHTGICPNEFETSYSPDRPEQVYCEKCYQQEVV